MTVWSCAIWALLPPLCVSALAALRGSVASRLVALQLLNAVGIAILIAMSFAFDQDSYLSLAEALAFLNVTGGLLMAITVERWL